MKTIPATAIPPDTDTDWVAFSGGELEGKRPRALCPACRGTLNRAASSRISAFSRSGAAEECAESSGIVVLAPLRAPMHRAARPLCFQCYRAELGRQRQLQAAGELDTASEERFQVALPLEPVNRARLERLRVERHAARVVAQAGVGRFVDRRHRAQIAARHALQRLADGLRARGSAGQAQPTSAGLHAAEMQLPESWLPFVASR